MAGDVLRWNAEELAKSVLAVAGQLELIDQSFEVVMSGVLFQVSELYRQAFIERMVSRAPQADCRLFTAPPVVGAALMAMQLQRDWKSKKRVGRLFSFPPHPRQDKSRYPQYQVRNALPGLVGALR